MIGWLLACAAFATPDAELLVERARVALAEARPDEARHLALEAVKADPDVWAAHRLYLKASAAAGIPSLAAAEFVGRSATDPLDAVVWHWWRVSRNQEPIGELEALADGGSEQDLARVALAWSRWRTGDREGALTVELPAEAPLAERLRLRADVRGERVKDAVKRGKAWLAAHPDHPDVLEEWWDGPDSGAIARAQRWAVKRLADEVEVRDDPLWALRALQVLTAAKEKELANVLVDRIDAAGLGRPLARGGWNPAMLHTMGRVLVRQRDPVVPPGTRHERFEMASSLSAALVDRGRIDEAHGVWRELRETDPSARAALAHAVFLVDADRPVEALEAARDAARAVGRPLPDDVGLLRTADQAFALAEAHALQAELHLAADRPAAARWAAWVANAVDPHPRFAALWARTLAVDAGDGRLDPVLAEVSRQEPGADGESLELLVATLLNRARQADLDAALGTLAIAVQLLPLDSDVHTVRAARLAEAGHAEAAFVAAAVSGDDGPEWQGLGSAPVDAARAAWRAALDGHEARLAVLNPVAEDAGGSAAAASGSTRERVRLGRPMPEWSLSVGPTVFDNGSTAGRPLVLAIWASWCGPCQLELPEIDAVVTELGGEGLPVTAVAISIDEHEKLFKRARAKRRYESLVVGWKPSFAKEFRVVSLPTTWIVAPDGTVVHQQTGYDELFVAKLERLLRRHSADQ